MIDDHRSTLAEHEAELETAITERQAARNEFTRTENPLVLSRVETLGQTIYDKATTLVIARDLLDRTLDDDDRLRIDLLLGRTVESRKAVTTYRQATHPPDPYPVELDGDEPWDDLDDPFHDFHLLDIRAGFNRENTDAEWLIDPLIAAHRGHAIYAKAGEGKSWTVLAAVVALALGRAFLNTPAGPPRHVLFLDFEMTEDDFYERLEAFGYGPNEDWSHLHYALVPDLPPLNSERGGDRVLEAALGLGVELVVIDTTGRAVTGKESESDTIAGFYRHTGQRLKQRGIALVRVDHAGKVLDLGQRGSSAKNDDVDVVWQVTRTDTGQQWTAEKRRTMWVPPKVVIDVAENGDGVWRFSTDAALAWPAGTKGLADELLALGVPVGMGRPTVRREYGDRFTATNVVLAAALKFNRERAALGQIEMPSGYS